MLFKLFLGAVAVGTCLSWPGLLAGCLLSVMFWDPSTQRNDAIAVRRETVIGFGLGAGVILGGCVLLPALFWHLYVTASADYQTFATQSASSVSSLTQQGLDRWFPGRAADTWRWATTALAAVPPSPSQEQASSLTQTPTFALSPQEQAPTVPLYTPLGMPLSA